MALFELKKYTTQTFTVTQEMRDIIALGKLDESQAKKFDKFPELLLEELENESRCPEASSLDVDIFEAVYDNDPYKFMRCVSLVGADNGILDRVFSWLLNKKTAPTPEELKLAALEKCFLDLEEREKALIKVYNRGKLDKDGIWELKGMANRIDDARLPEDKVRRLRFLRKRREVTKRDVALLKRIERSRSIYNVFDY